MCHTAWTHAGLSPASRVLALSMFVLAVLLNYVPFLLPHDISGDKERKVGHMFALKIMVGGMSATAMTVASVLTSEIANAVPG